MGLVSRIACAAFLGVMAAAAAPSDGEIDAKVGALLRRMSLAEKIGQMTQFGALSMMPNAPKPEPIVKSGGAGSILWLSDPKEINRLQKVAVEQSRLGIPLIFGLDVIHGFRTIFPMPLALAASWDPALIERAQAIAAREARASGISWTFAPMLDICRDPRWGRLIEGPGEDPYLGAAVARAQVRGFQGDDMSLPDRVMACAKHFAGYGAAEGGRDYDSVFLSDTQLWNVYLPPFRAAAEAGVGTFMSAYMDLNDVPGAANPFLLTDVLRKAWKFRGFVVSDAFAVRDLVTHGFARDRRDAAYRAVTAGLDMDMASGTFAENLAALVQAGRVPAAAIDAAVRPILAAKYRLGLFDHPYVDESRAASVLGIPAHRDAARVAAQRSCVLLRNEKELLPLAKDGSKAVAVIGPLADSRRDMLSMWAGFHVDASTVVTVSEGIRHKLGAGARVETAPGVQITKRYHSMFESLFGSPEPPAWTADQAKAEFDRAVAVARKADIVILALGERALMSGEAASQSSLELPGRQQELMQAVLGAGKPAVLVLINGRPLDIEWAAGHVDAILEAWHPGMEGGSAIADVLFGDANPGGKLPLTWPRNVGQVPVYYAHNLTHQPETARGFTSRTWDQSSAPLYPFGYGLSYSRFAISRPRLSAAEVKLGQGFRVAVEVQNTGARAGDEVVQVYIHQRAGSASRPVRELKGFQRVTLAPGEKKTVTFPLGKGELSYWSTAARGWVQEPASFDLWVGADSTANEHAEFQVIQ